MFDNYCTKNNININAVSGTIVKNYKKSFLLHFSRKSDLWNRIQGDHPKYYSDKCNKLDEIVVLQIMIAGNDLFIAEVMWKNDFEELFKDQ